jgi:hypothetical protein
MTVAQSPAVAANANLLGTYLKDRRAKLDPAALSDDQRVLLPRHDFVRVAMHAERIPRGRGRVRTTARI